MIPAYLLNAVCSIERRGTTGAVDAYGHVAGDVDYDAVSTSVACRVESQSGDQVGGPARERNADAVRMFFAEGQDVQKDDRVIIEGVTYRVDSVDELPGGTTGSHVEAVGVVMR